MIELIKKALQEYEENHWETLSEADQEQLNYLCTRVKDPDFGRLLLAEAGYFGIKLWSPEDILCELESRGYGRDPNMVPEVMRFLRALDNATSEDYYILENAVESAARECGWQSKYID